MNDLIKRALEVHDELRECAEAEGTYYCEECVYYANGCIDRLMLDAAKVIGRLIENTQED